MAIDPAISYLRRLAEGSRPAQRTALRIMAGLLRQDGEPTDPFAFPWWDLDYERTSFLRSELAAAYAPATCNRMLAALRGVLKEAWRLERMEVERYQRAADVERVRGTGLARGRALDRGELLALFEACADGTPAGARDAALLAVMYGGGLRRSEAVSLDVTNWRKRDRAITVVRGKGRRARVVPVPEGVARALDAWLKVRKRKPGPLFCRVRRGGVLKLGQELAPESVQRMVAARAAAAGVERCAPHDFRRSFVTDLLDAGADLAVAQRLAGHADMGTTVRYDKRGDAATRRAAELLHVPFQGGGRKARRSRASR